MCVHMWTFPAAGESLECTLVLTNPSNVRLFATTVPGQPNCTALPATLMPGASASCRVSKVTTQADFDTWDLAIGSSDSTAGRLQLSVTATAQPAAKLALQQATGTVAVPLVSRPSFKLPTAALAGGNASQSVKAGEPCRRDDPYHWLKHKCDAGRNRPASLPRQCHVAHFHT
jgi:hypothetical protein